MSYPTPTIEDLRIVALTIFGEARGEDDRGRLAVGWVIKNRTALYVKRMHAIGHDHEKNPYAAICLARYQFSCWNENDPNVPLLYTTLPLHDPVFVRCLMNAVGVLGGHADDLTDGATHYLNVSLVLKQAGRLPMWAADPNDRQKVNEQLVVARIGQHTFLQTA